MKFIQTVQSELSIVSRDKEENQWELSVSAENDAGLAFSHPMVEIVSVSKNQAR